MSCGAVVVAAGQSRRMGFDKTRVQLGGRAVLLRVLDVIDQSPDICQVVVVTSPAAVKTLQRELLHESFRHEICVVTGGETRPESVRNGVRALALEVELVLIHDAARPLLTLDLIERGVRAGREFGAAVAAVPISDTIKRVNPDGSIDATVDRAQLYAAQTPQVFLRSWLDVAYGRLGDELSHGIFTDEASLLERAGCRVKIFPGSAENIKLTVPSDVDLAQAILSQRERTDS